MDNKADKIIQNIGAAAEATALFYNTLAKQVPSNVALELTKQYIWLWYFSRIGPHRSGSPIR